MRTKERRTAREAVATLADLALLAAVIVTYDAFLAEARAARNDVTFKCIG